jgi:hypothetical protein
MEKQGQFFSLNDERVLIYDNKRKSFIRDEGTYLCYTKKPEDATVFKLEFAKTILKQINENCSIIDYYGCLD